MHDSYYRKTQSPPPRRASQHRPLLREEACATSKSVISVPLSTDSTHAPTTVTVTSTIVVTGHSHTHHHPLFLASPACLQFGSISTFACSLAPFLPALVLLLLAFSPFLAIMACSLHYDTRQQFLFPLPHRIRCLCQRYRRKRLSCNFRRLTPSQPL